jgi:hypothetical protein
MLTPYPAVDISSAARVPSLYRLRAGKDIAYVCGTSTCVAVNETTLSVMV